MSRAAEFTLLDYWESSNILFGFLCELVVFSPIELVTPVIPKLIFTGGLLLKCKVFEVFY